MRSISGFFGLSFGQNSSSTIGRRVRAIGAALANVHNENINSYRFDQKELTEGANNLHASILVKLSLNDLSYPQG
jgi:hypothetical protein